VGLSLGLNQFSVRPGGTRLTVSSAHGLLSGSVRHHVGPGCNRLGASIPLDVLFAGACAQVLGEWLRAPVISGG
jgi:hypothetical protein